MIDLHESDIRDRAYALWQQAGSPDGREQEFWQQAERELAEEQGVDTSEENSEVKKPPMQVGSVPV